MIPTRYILPLAWFFSLGSLLASNVSLADAMSRQSTVDIAYSIGLVVFSCLTLGINGATLVRRYRLRRERERLERELQAALERYEAGLATWEEFEEGYRE